VVLSDYLHKYTAVICISLYIKTVTVLHEIIVTECSSTCSGMLLYWTAE